VRNGIRRTLRGVLRLERQAHELQAVEERRAPLNADHASATDFGMLRRATRQHRVGAGVKLHLHVLAWTKGDGQGQRDQRAAVAEVLPAAPEHAGQIGGAQ